MHGRPSTIAQQVQHILTDPFRRIKNNVPKIDCCICKRTVCWTLPRAGEVCLLSCALDQANTASAIATKAHISDMTSDEHDRVSSEKYLPSQKVSRLGENKEIMRWLFSPIFMRKWQKMWIFYYWPIFERVLFFIPQTLGFALSK